MGQKDQKVTQRICEDLDKGTFLNGTLDGPLPNQDEAREELHNEYEEKRVCHIYKGEKHCHCGPGEKCVVWDWGKDVAEQILAAPKREIERSEEAGKEGIVIPRYGFACELLQKTQAGTELLKNIEEKIEEEKKKK